MSLNIKICSKCNATKSMQEFSLDLQKRDGYRPDCKICVSARRRGSRAEIRGAIGGRWDAIMQRCYNSKCPSFRNYGGRGIKVCDYWLVKESFIDDIITLIGPAPSGMSLDRIDNNGDYRPGNLRWATISEQNKNRRRTPISKRNVSGVTGVWRHKRGWRAGIMRNGEERYFGTFPSIELASYAISSFLEKSGKIE